MYKQFPYAGFGGGLNLRDGPDVVKDDQAIDAMNVLFTTRGAVAQRSGYAELTTAEPSARYDSLGVFYKVDGTKRLVAGYGGNLDAISTAGAVLTTDPTPTVGPHYFARFGGPTAEHLYIANGTDTVNRYDGAAFAVPAYAGTTPTGKFLAVSVTDNRLVNARFGGAVAGNNPSTVRFSSEGDPTTWGATQYVDLTPGDGEEIMGMVSWRDKIIVFKQTKFFVFFGQSIDDDGEPVFNYTTVDTGIGLAASKAIAVSEQGVYYLNRSGVYFTSGSQPTRVSDVVETIFHGGSSVYYLGGELNDGSISECTMVYHDERLWLNFPGGSSSVNSRNLVLDPNEKWWTVCDMPIGACVNFRPGNVEELVFSYASGEKHLGRYVDGLYTADDMEPAGTGGTAITARWQGAWFDYGSPIVKTIRELKLTGTGLVTVSIARDWRQNFAVSVSRELTAAVGTYDSGLLYDTPGLLYGPSGVIAPKSVRKAIRGEAFSLRFTNSTIYRSFKVHRLTTHVRETRVPTVVKVA